jgi:hypothetical protein
MRIRGQAALGCLGMQNSVTPRDLDEEDLTSVDDVLALLRAKGGRATMAI